MANKTSYTPENLHKALELIKEAKNIVVKAQDFAVGALMRDAERILLVKQDADKNRKL